MPIDRENFEAFQAAAVENADQIIRSAVFGLVTDLKFSSPVDTGRFRASWTVARGTSIPAPLPEGNYPPEDSIRFSGISARDVKLGGFFHVVNNTEYSEFLNEANHLADHEPGWIDSMGREYTDSINSQMEEMVEDVILRYLG